MTYRIDYLDYGNRLGSATVSGTLEEAIAHAKGDGRRGRRDANCALIVDVGGSGGEVASIRFDTGSTLVSRPHAAVDGSNDRVILGLVIRRVGGRTCISYLLVVESSHPRSRGRTLGSERTAPAYLTLPR